MICTWCRAEINKGEQVYLNERQLALCIVYCTSHCMDTSTRYYSAMGIPVKVLEENKNENNG